MMPLPHALRAFLLLLALAVAAPASALQQPPLQERVAAEMARAAQGTRFGLLVTTEDGRELIAVNPDGRFIPASNTKMLTTAAAFANLAGLDQPDAAGGASVRLAANGDVVLTGGGDARLSSARDCVSDCLAALADAVAARTRRVRNVIGDDSLFPDQRWSPGMSWNNIQSRYGTAVSALTLDDNELWLRVLPGVVGQPPTLVGLPYYEIDNRAVTVAQGSTELRVLRLPGSRTLQLTGTILDGPGIETLRLGIDDPAHYAAWRLAQMLAARGVAITGTAEARHRLAGAPAPAEANEPVLARLTPAPLSEDLLRINKESQNLHAELMLRRVGRVRGSGSIEDGVAAVATMMESAGAPRTGWDLSDGSGMSTYNRLSPGGCRAAALGTKPELGRGLAPHVPSGWRRRDVGPPLPGNAA